ncbi:MAG TPA: TlpA family protein disulfide reductase [Candidatus Alistipes avistercoris]|nr:TlpA family protein disulfide reductase [Candidatus Alistipes avistercoris]
MARKKKSNGQLWVMLALIVIIIAVIFLLPSCGNRSAKGGASQSDSTTLVKVGDPAPDFSVALFDGSHLTLSELRGKVVLLNFWATWCPPCRQELTRVQKDLIDRFAGRDFLFLPVSRGEKRSDVAAFREQTGYTFPMGLDSTRTIYNRYATNFIPRNYLIDRDGRIITATIGYSPEEFDELIAAIERALAGKE